MSTAKLIKNEFLGGAARTAGRVAPLAGVGFWGYNWLENKVGSTTAKLLLGASGFAIAYAAFGGIKSAISNTASLVKNAAALAIAGVGLYFGASFFFNKSAKALPPSGTAAFDFDNLFDLKQLWRTLTGSTAANSAVASPPHAVDHPSPHETPNKAVPNVAAGDKSPPVIHMTTSGDEASQIEAAKNAAKAVIAKGPTAIARELKNILAATKAGRLAGNIPIAGSAIGIGAGVATYYAFDLQRGYAEALYKNGTITTEAKNSYMELSRLNQKIFTGDIALSTLDPTGVSILATLGAENKTYYNFQNWLDVNANNLTSEQAAGLSMSLFTPDTVSANLLKSVRQNIPNTIAGQPQILHATIEANQNYKTASKKMFSEYEKNVRKALNSDSTALRNNETVRVIQGSSKDVEAIRKTALADGRTGTAQALEKYIKLKAEVESAHNKLVTTLAQATKTPEGLNAYLNLTPIEYRLTFAARLTKGDKNISAHPQIATYAAARETWNPFDGRGARDALTKNPALLNTYIQGRLSSSNTSKTPAPQQHKRTTTALQVDAPA